MASRDRHAPQPPVQAALQAGDLEIAGRLLDPATQRIDAMTYGNGQLAVVLRPRDPAAFAALMEELRGKASIPGLDVRVDTVQSADARQLRITAKVEGGRWALAKP